MGANIWFWLIYVIVGLFGIWGVGPWQGPNPNPYRMVGGWVVLFILIGLLGWHDFGSPLR